MGRMTVQQIVDHTPFTPHGPHQSSILAVSPVQSLLIIKFHQSFGCKTVNDLIQQMFTFGCDFTDNPIMRARIHLLLVIIDRS
jgi:hypothetical protein